MIKITPTSEAVKFHNEKVNEIFDKLISDGYILRNKKQKKICKDFINFLIKYKDELINALPNRLLEIHEEFEMKNFSKHQIVLIRSFFIQTGYGKFQNKEFLNFLGIDTCVYCNRNYTLYFGENNARAELDHWFPKSEFPILALSFYNLIPSCHSCNHIKLNNSPIGGWKNALNVINHPYLDKNDFKFSYYYNSFSDFNLNINVKMNSKSNETLKFNKINEIYSAHSNKELNDLLSLRYKYSDNYIDILVNKTFIGTPFSKEEIYRMIFGIEIHPEDYHKRPFSKFKHDIIEELKQTKKY
ncbi:HNH endonuclease domain-containing protein [Flavobacterium filum]|uniref:HNH endonuclease n=1 Tax=Flavobacterium TaxID=237 RepID=UPI000409E9CF|nr:HNH endonuclease domain-containing protein [Flavobacterium filum]